MGRFLALEWDGREARIAVARAERGATTVERVEAIPLSAPAGQSLSPEQIGRKIAAALSSAQINPSRVETLVAVGRASIELKLLSLPPAPDDELPELVRFQAMREFTSLGDDWPLDFVPLAASAGEPREVLAAAIAPALVAQIRATCDAASLTPKAMALRPCATASLLRRLAPGKERRARLLVDPMADEVDLTVLVDDAIVFMRTVRLPASTDVAERNKSLLTEIRRTMAAVHNQLGARRIDAITLCGGDADELDDLADQLGEQVKLPVDRFDPFASMNVEVRRPEHPGRFAPLLGMIYDAAAGTAHDVDFLNPKRKPEPPSRRKAYILAGSLAVAVGLLATVWIYWALGSIDDEIARVQADINAKTKAVAAAETEAKRASRIDDWAAGDVPWLDELRSLSESLPPPEKAIVTNFRAYVAAKGPTLAVTSAAVDDEAIDAIVAGMRAPNRTVEPGVRDASTDTPGYSRKFVATAVYGPPKPPETRPPETKPPAANQSKTPVAAKKSGAK
jgi:Tfp pilus assembly PilM family ATPase